MYSPLPSTSTLEEKNASFHEEDKLKLFVLGRDPEETFTYVKILESKTLLLQN